MNVRKVALLALMTMAVGGVVAVTAYAFQTPPPVITSSQQPASVTVGGSIADQVTVTGSYTCQPDNSPESLVGQSVSDGLLNCTYQYMDNYAGAYVCKYSASTGALTAAAPEGDVCPAEAVAPTGGTPTGSVTFTLYNNEQGTGTPLFTDPTEESLVNGVATSASYTATAAGTDYWVVSYSGDTNYSETTSSGSSAPVTIDAASPAISTNKNVFSGSIIVGDSTSDQVTVSGGYSPTGTVSFSLYSNNTCTGSPLNTVTPRDLNNSIVTSDPYTTTAAGTDYWLATYSGDSNNNIESTPCLDDPITVGKASPTVTTMAASDGLYQGQSTSDQATVTGGYSPTGTVTFSLYSNDSCTGMPLFTDADESLSSGGASSMSYTPSTTGTDYWVATYSGDSNNKDAKSSCFADPVTIIPSSQTISFEQHLGPYGIEGTSVELSATASSKLPVSYTTTGPCSVTGSELTLNGVGVCKLTALQVGGSGYAPAPSVTRSITVEYGIKGFADPASKANLRPGAKIEVGFALTNAAGKSIPAAAAAALAKGHDLKAILSGPGFTAQSSTCTLHKAEFECVITAPKKPRTGHSHPYSITADEKVDGEFVTVAPLGSAHNPETVYFK